jgi:uncharacterized membrane protein YfcA
MLNMLSLGLISVPVGFLGSLIGLGGAAMLTPLLVLTGVPIKEAIACCMVTIIATSAGSASSYVRQRITNIKVAMYLEMFTITGAIIGATITTKIDPVYLYFFFAAFLMLSFFRLRESKGVPALPVKQDRVSRWLELHGSYYDEAHKKVVEYKVNNALLGGAGMMVAGLAAGMLGIGAGAFKVTVHEKIMHMPTKVSSTTSNFVIGMTALAGTSIYLFSGLLNLTLMAPMAIGATLGAIIGGRLLNKISNNVLKILFLIVVIALIGQMLFKGISAI